MIYTLYLSLEADVPPPAPSRLPPCWPRPAAWSWDFGDGSASPATCQSNLRNPSHTYAANGTYTVNLAVSNASGSASRSTTVQIDGSNDSEPICGN